MTEIHRAAAAGFSANADGYVRGRPEYPPAIVDWLRTELGLAPGTTVLDLGSGTGKFVTPLQATGAHVVAVEPVAEMRAQAIAANPGLETVAGTADAIPLANSSIDAVVCAQSFHWFATPQALAEIDRVLRPGGSLGLIWNVRDESVPWIAALTALMAPYEKDTPRYTSGEWQDLFPAAGFSALQEQCFFNAHAGPPARVIVERVLSVSFIAALPADERDRVRSKLEALIAATPELLGQSIVTVPYTTHAFACKKLG